MHIDLPKTTLKRISNWKAPGHDRIQGFWFQKFTSIHGRLAQEMNRCLQGTQVSDWMTKRKTTLIPKDPSKGTASNNYRPITCLPNKGKDLLLANKPRIVPWRTERMPQRIQRHSRITLHWSIHPKWEQDKTEKSSYGLDWRQKGYDMVPQSWILHCLKMYKISHEVINFIEKTMQTWRVELTAGGRSLTETKIQRGIFQGDAWSTWLFIIAMMTLNHVLRKCTAGYKLSKSQGR